MPAIDLRHGDCLALLKTLPDNSVDAVVTDPPYGLADHSAEDVAAALRCWLDGKEWRPKKRGFMGRSWDGFVPGPEVWRECLRVLKPGGHLVCFAGTRTVDLMGIAIRLAGFEIRDEIMWMYGCLSEDTELFMDGRWTKHHDIKSGGLTVEFDVDTGELRWTAILDVFRYDHTGPAFSISSGRTDQLVSPEHRVVTGVGDAWRFERACEIQATQILVPVLEDVRDVCAAFPGAHEGAGGEEQVLRQRVLGEDQAQEAAVAAERRDDRLQRLRQVGVEAGRVAKARGAAHLLEPLQRESSGSAVRKQQGPQAVRGTRRPAADLAAFRPVHYVGVMWCVRVASGAFVARRNGKIFITGNSGFPKGIDVGKAVDKIYRAQLSRRRALEFTRWLRSTGITAREVNEFTGSNMGSHYLTDKEQPAVPTAAMFDLIRPRVGVVPAEIEALIRDREVESENAKRRPVVGKHDDPSPGDNMQRGLNNGDRVAVGDRTAAFTNDAKMWEGWNTALKPGHEPVIVARKPLVGTVAENVLRHGCGAVNVDGCRVGETKRVPGSLSRTLGMFFSGRETGEESGHNPNVGRWPANVVHDGSDDVLALFPDSAGQLARSRNDGHDVENPDCYGSRKNVVRGNPEPRGDAGSAGRFFKTCPFVAEDLELAVALYCAKATRAERREGQDDLAWANTSPPTPITLEQRAGLLAAEAFARFISRQEVDFCVEVAHPTVKPLALMRWLCRLVTKPGGVVLDPFSGSGTTARACQEEGFAFVGFEREAEYVEIARRRLAANAKEQP